MNIILAFTLQESVFPNRLDSDLQEYLIRSGVEWSLLDEALQFDTEKAWRAIFGNAFKARPRLRRGSKAEHEYLLQPCSHFLIVPFTSDVDGLPVCVHWKTIGAYRCLGTPVPLGLFHDAEFFVSPPDFEWTMIHTHEDHGFDGPFFIRREWLC